MSQFQFIITKAAKLQKKILFTDGAQPKVLAIASAIAAEGIAHPILLGTSQKIIEVAKTNGIILDGIDIITPQKSHLFTHFTNEIVRQKGHSKETEAYLKSSLNFGLAVVKIGEADILVVADRFPHEGIIASATEIIGLKEELATPSNVCFLESADQFLTIPDCWIDPPTSNQLADIAITSARTHNQLTGKMPRVEFVYPDENSSIVQKIRAAVEMIRFREHTVSVFELTDMSQALQSKNSVLMFPEFYIGKMITDVIERFGKYSVYGPLLQGFKKSVQPIYLKENLQDSVAAISMSILI